MKTILTDADGVILQWEIHFHRWMEARGYNKSRNDIYHMDLQYNISREESKRLVIEFNNSSWMIDCPPLRDARSGVAKLYEQGYNFICITSMSLDPYSKELRWQNIRNLFGSEAFIDLVCLDTGGDKDLALHPYKDSGLWFIEDKPENAILGADLGLNTIIVDHTYNREVNDPRIRRAQDWKEITGIILNERPA